MNWINLMLATFWVWGGVIIFFMLELIDEDCFATSSSNKELKKKWCEK